MLVFSILLLAQYAAAKVKQSQIGENANPDLSGSVQFFAPRLDRTYPGSWGDETPNPWTLELNVTRDRVEGPNLGSRAPLFTLQVIPPAPGLDGAVYLPNGSYTVGDVDIYAVHPNTESWNVMMGVTDWTPGLEVPEANDKQRGSCPESIWTKECVAAMRSAIKEADEYNHFNASGLPACKGQPDLNFPYFGVNPQGDFTASTIDRNVAYGGYDDTLREYDRRGLSTFPVALIFNIPYWLKTPQPPLPDENIVFACVRIDTTHNGAKMPTGQGAKGQIAKGSAQHVGGQGSSALWFALASGLILLIGGL